MDALTNPLEALHDAADAEWLEYAGVRVVQTFGNPQAEYAAMHRGAGLFDLPFRGTLCLRGRDRHAFLGNLLTAKVYDRDTKVGLSPGRSVSAFLLNLRGRVVLETVVSELPDGRTILDLDAACVPVLNDVLDRYRFAEDVTVDDVSGETSTLALIGPATAQWLGRLVENTPDDMPAGRIKAFVGRFEGQEVLARMDDLCGHGRGYRLILPRSTVEAFWTRATEAFDAVEPGKRLSRPIGWAAFNTVRIEQGRPLPGIDFEAAPASLPRQPLPTGPEGSRGLLPAETGLLEEAVSFDKGCYLGQEVVARMHARGQLARKIVGFRMAGEELPIAGTKVLDADGNEVGIVTSSTSSPVLSRAAIGLALAKRPFFDAGTPLHIPAEGAVRPAAVVKTPFV